MNVVMGIEEQLLTCEDEELRAQGERLRRTAETLTDISKKAGEIDRLFQEPTGAQEISLSELCEPIVSPLAEEYPAASIDVSVGEETVWTGPELLGALLKEVVANALEHTGAEPTVHVEVDPTEAGVDITVTDDGPGIPQMEVDPLAAGEETPLEHTTSIGIWFVTWGIQLLGGTVEFDPTETGTRVTMSVPDRRETDGRDAVGTMMPG